MGLEDATAKATIVRLAAERDHAIRELDRWQTLCEQTAAALKGADAEIARLRAREAAPRWWCICERLQVGGEACGNCGREKPKADGRHA